MASTNHGKAQLISHKLNFLKNQRDRLISAVNEIIAAGESWTHRGGNNLEYQKLSQMIDTTAEFLCDKCAELTGGPVGVAANQLSCEQPGQTSQLIAAASSTPATSYRQPAAPLASTTTTSYIQSTESVQAAGEDQLKPVLAKIAVIEEALYSFRSRTEKVADQQSCIDQQLKELLSKLSESDQKHSSRFKQVEQQICDIRETQDAIKREQKTRLQRLEKQLQKVSKTQNRQKAEVESQAELAEKLVHVRNLLESVKEKVDALEDRIDGCRNKHEDMETVTRDLADKVMANTQSSQVLSEGQDTMTTFMKQLETRLQTMEADGGRNEKDVQKQVEKGETNFRILCQMLNDRLRPLEQLRTCLNERASMRDDNVTKLSKLIQEVAVMSPRLQQLEVKSPGTRCGFSAWTMLTGGVADKTIIKHYTTPNCNVGGNFNADSGIFTAPVDGLYVAAVSLRLWENGHVGVSVDYKQNVDQASRTSLCWCSAETKQTTACDVGIVDMKAGEVLYSRVYSMDKNCYRTEVHFSCFLLG